MRILLQFPEGLKRKALVIAEAYEKEGHEVFLSASACYGACDIALDEARALNAGKIVHYGHSRFPRGNGEIPVEYVPYSIDADLRVLSAALPHLEGKKRVALATTVQHIHQLGQMKEFFEKNGKTVLVGKGELCAEPGQILGCDAGAVKSVEKDADAIVFVGEGMFHALALDSKKPAYAISPYGGGVKDLSADIERLRRKRMGALAKALTCESFGILLSTKPGQANIEGALWARGELEKRGVRCAILVANELEPMNVKNFMAFGCLVNTACPRMADDTEEWGMPMLNLGTLKEALAMMDSGGKQ